MDPTAEESLRTGREAVARYAWREAFERLAAPDLSGRLCPEDLEGLAAAAWWTGRLGECIAARERAFAGYLESGRAGRAARVALELVRDHYGKQNSVVANAWLKRAERLLDELPESVEHGYLARMRCVIVFEGLRDFDAALADARQTFDIGTRFGDRDLMAIGLHDQGRVLVAKGQLADGIALMDEATVAAVSGELGPLATGIVYCNMITACEQLADYRRAGEWTEAAKRWCERQAIAGFPGLCRVHRAGIMRIRGAWPEAEREARRACDELREFNLNYTASAFHELGEIRLQAGDLAGAEEAFRQAHELGRDPQPGLSLLRLAEGKVDAALAAIKNALADASPDRLTRARLLPAQVAIALAAGHPEAAGSAAEELEAIARAYPTPALEANASGARGAVQLAEGDTAGARRSLRRACRFWQEVEAPYEAARARMLLAAACRAEGEAEAAALELEAARSIFERLGALRDARRAAQLLEELEGPRGAQPGARPDQTTRTFMFTDIVESTKLVEAIGDEAWDELLRWHDRTLRSLFAESAGEEIDHAGDGFFVAFEIAASANECAAAIQRTLAEHRRAHGFSPQVRIGLHTTRATRRGAAYRGKGVHQAARIAAVAEAGEIAASQETIGAIASLRFRASESRLVRLKGISEPMPVVKLDWRGGSET